MQPSLGVQSVALTAAASLPVPPRIGLASHVLFAPQELRSLRSNRRRRDRKKNHVL